MPTWWISTCIIAGVWGQSAPRVLPVSELPVALVGVAVNTDAPSKSAVMIRCTLPSVPSGTAVLTVGQRACDLAEITDIRADGVIIKNLQSGAMERLPLRTSGPADTPAATPPPAAQPPVAPTVTTTAAGLDVSVPQAMVDHYLVNLSELLTAALASPHFTTSASGTRVMDGFELGEIKPGSVIEQLGLKNGDIIQSVNGEKLDSLAAAIRLAAQAQNAAGGTMVVSRKGELLTFVFKAK